MADLTYTWAVGQHVIVDRRVLTIERLTPTQAVLSDGCHYLRRDGHRIGSRRGAHSRARHPQPGEIEAIERQQALVAALHEIERQARRYTGWGGPALPASAEQVAAAQSLVAALKGAP